MENLEGLEELEGTKTQPAPGASDEPSQQKLPARPIAASKITRPAQPAASAPGSARSRAQQTVVGARLPPCLPPRFVYVRVPLAAARRALPLAREGKEEATE